jgi:hypothetical protein
MFIIFYNYYIRSLKILSYFKEILNKILIKISNKVIKYL